MLIIVAIMLTGVLAGVLLRNRDLSAVPHMITIAIRLLLFLLGVAVGCRRDILDNLHTIGLQALVITAGGLAGTLVCARLVYRRFFTPKD